MKRLGLVGSHSLETTLGYVRTINREVEKWAGLGHTAELIVLTGNSARFHRLLDGGEWQTLRDELGQSACNAAAAGADALVVCGSCLNPLADELGATLGFPVICLGNALVDTLARFRLKRAAFLGLRTNREAEMWRDFLSPEAVMRPMAPDERRLREIIGLAADADDVPNGWEIDTTRIISGLRRDGAQAVVLCAPELGRVVRMGETPLPVFDAGEVHAWAAAHWALGKERLPRN